MKCFKIATNITLGHVDTTDVLLVVKYLKNVIMKSKSGKFISRKKYENQLSFKSSFAKHNGKKKTTTQDYKKLRKTPSESNQFSGSWRDGRRIVELGLLSDQLESGCTDCKKYLKLSQIETEIRQGFGSILYVKCECGVINKVKTGKTHETGKGHYIFDVNSKAALGMIDAGIGPTQVLKLNSVINIPTPDAKTLKKREREVGKAIEIEARSSCEEALQEEINLTEKK